VETNLPKLGVWLQEGGWGWRFFLMKHTGFLSNQQRRDTDFRTTADDKVF